MANSSVSVTEGSGKNLATYSFTETTTKEVSRIALNTNAGVEITFTKVSANFNRPANATPYTANDAVNDNTTAGSVTKLSFSIAAAVGRIYRVRIRESDQTVATPTIRLWLWDTTFTVASGDNAAFSEPLQDTVGFVDVAVTNAGTDDAVGYSNCDIPFTGGTIYGLLQTLSGFTPASGETFTISLWYLPG